jgi:VWFA-related protein
MVNNHASRLTMDPEREIIRTLQQMYQAGISCPQLEPVAASYADEEYRRTRETIGGLQRFIESLAGLRGRKAILHVSNGLPLVAGRGGMEYLIDVCSPAGLARGANRDQSLNGRIFTGDVQLSSADSSRYDTSQAWHELAARANRNNVTFYPLQAIGLRDPTFPGADTPVRTLSPTAGVNTSWNRQDALVMVAVDTGGAAILNQNRVAEALGRMQNDLRHYYRLSVLVEDGVVGEVEKIAVRVDRPRAKVRHRKSLRLQSRSEKVADGVLAAALHGAGENSMGLTAEMQGSTRIDKNLRKVRVKLKIPLASLTLLPGVPGADDKVISKGLFTVFVAATDADGGTTPVRRSTLSVERKQDQARKPETYVFEVEMEMRKGEHVVGFGVLDEIGGGSSFLRTVVNG